MKPVLRNGILAAICWAAVNADAAQIPLDDSSGWALKFDGAGGYASVPHRDALNSFPLTLTVWLNTAQTNGTRPIVTKSRIGPRGGWYRLMLQDGALVGSYGGNTLQAMIVIDSGPKVSDGFWHHLAMVVDTNGASLYVDGQLRGSEPWKGTGPLTSTDPLLFGSYGGSLINAYSGLIDEVAVWNRALSQSELCGNIHRQLTRTESGLVACWRMNEPGGEVLFDASPQHFDAYLSNTVARVKSCIPAGAGGLTFNSDGDCLRVPSFGPQLPERDISVEFWARIEVRGRLFALEPEDAANRLRAEVIGDPPKLSWVLGNPATGSTSYQVPGEHYGTWQHFALVSSQTGRFMRIYRNGRLEAWQTEASSLGPTVSDLLVGSAGMQIAEFRVWGKALDAADIQSNLDRRLSGGEPGLIAYFPLNERAGEFAFDLARDHNLGLLSLDTTWVSTPILFKPDATTLAVSDLSTSNSTLNATINPNGELTTAWFEWGTEFSEKTASAILGLGTTPLPFSCPLTGLTAGVTYPYRVVASNTAGLSYGADSWFIASFPPSVDTLAGTGAAYFEKASFTFEGTASPNWSPTRAWFIWGPDVLCRNSTSPVDVGNGTNRVTVRVPLSGLPAESIYHYRLVASNTAGVVVGPEKTIFAPGIKLHGDAFVKVVRGADFVDLGARVTRPIINLAAGAYHCLALTYDGRVVAWGAGLNNDEFPNRGQSRVPSGLSDVVAIAAGALHSMALRNDGRVVVWGHEDILPHGTVPGWATNIVAIGAGSMLSVVVDASGDVGVWGPFAVVGPSIPPPEVNDIVMADAGLDLVLEVRKDGTLLAWGNGPFPPRAFTNVVALDSVEYVSMVLERNGLVSLWGGAAPDAPADLTNAVAIANGERQFLALREDGRLTGWSWDAQGLLIPPGLSNVVGIAEDFRTNYVLQVEGTVAQWAASSGQDLSFKDLSVFARPVEVTGYVNPSKPGLYLLSYAAATPWGIKGTASRLVVVEDNTPRGAQGLKTNALAQIDRLLSSPVQPKEGEILQVARMHLSDSLNPAFWADPSHLVLNAGARVYQEEKLSVLELERLVRQEKSSLLLSAIHGCISNIVAADRLLAVTALQDAAATGTDPERLAKAWRIVTDADALGESQCVSAVERYRTAWHHAALLQKRVTTVVSQGELLLSFAAVPGLKFQVESSSNLTGWRIVGKGQFSSDGIGRFSEPVATGNPRRFFRIKVMEDQEVGTIQKGSEPQNADLR